ncbi:hypothetical protein ZWY2020_018603 [Hordeum vulgare]|nr:hypothetical protein ZWY2020_018603 [Hordeum vulgare]
MSPTTEPLVDARFCAPHARTFTVTITNGWPWRAFTVTDEARGKAVMRVKASMASFCRRYRLVDAASRRTVVTVQHAPSLFVPERRWEAFRGASTSPADLLFEAVSQPALFNWGEIDVHLAGRDPGERLRQREFVVVCRGPAQCTVRRRKPDGAAAVVGKIEDTSERRLGYSVSVSPGVDHAFILALTVILDEMRLDEPRG